MPETTVRFPLAICGVALLWVPRIGIEDRNRVGGNDRVEDEVCSAERV
jgi:hypothetical protein